MDDLSLTRKYIGESIEDAISTKLSLSAFHLASAVQEDVEVGLEDTQSLIEQEAPYKLLKSKLLSSELPPTKFIKPKMKSTSSSLFDMFSSSSQLSQRLNIRDILDASESELLDRCYQANVDDLILGFNTTDAEIELLGSMLFDRLVLEISTLTSKKNYKHLSQSFLEIHVKWMGVCVNEEECHSFAFMLLRNVILCVQYAKLPVDKIRIVRDMMKILAQYMKLSNDGTSFQSSCTQILYLIIEVFFRKYKTSGGVHAVLAYYDQEGRLFSQIISSISSLSIVQDCILRTNFVQYLVDMIQNFSSNEILSLLQRMDNKLDPEAMLVVYLLTILKVAILNLSSLTFPYAAAETSENVNFLTLGDLPAFFSSFERKVSSSHEKSQLEGSALRLLEPFYQLLEIGINSDTSHFFNPTLENICEDAIVHIILCGCSRDCILLERAMSHLLKFMEKIISPLNNRASDCKMFEKEERSGGLLVLSPAPRALFQIYKRILTDIPWSDLGDYSFVEQHCASIFVCLHNYLSVSKDLELQIMSWNSTISVLLPITQIDGLKDSIANYQESIVALVTDHDYESIGMNSIEILMLLHCVLFSVKGDKVVGKQGENFARSISIYCWGLFLAGFQYRLPIDDNVISIAQKYTLSRHLTQTEVSSAGKWLNEALVVMTLMQQIKEMLN